MSFIISFQSVVSHSDSKDGGLTASLGADSSSSDSDLIRGEKNIMVFAGNRTHLYHLVMGPIMDLCV